MAIDELKTNGQSNIIELETAMIPIKEIIVKPMMPEEILEEVISRFDENYTSVPNDMTGFYRETIRKTAVISPSGKQSLKYSRRPTRMTLDMTQSKFTKEERVMMSRKWTL
ncbi:MAG: hypothetical protein MZV63_10790 [Marinilabiliales bacterium]|nr:hypothetical protein [Marinilabiliales bacterium]